MQSKYFGVSESKTTVENASDAKLVENNKTENRNMSKYWKYVNNDPKQLNEMIRRELYVGQVDKTKQFRELELSIRKGENRDKFSRNLRIIYSIIR